MLPIKETTIESVTMSLSPSPLTVFCGERYTGKTSLLDTIEYKINLKNNLGIRNKNALFEKQRYSKKDVFLLENPEHKKTPKECTEIGKNAVFAANNGYQCIIETQNPYIIQGIRITIKENRFDPALVQFIYFSLTKNKEVKLEVIKLNNQVRFDKHPKGFFDQTMKNMAILARR